MEKIELNVLSVAGTPSNNRIFALILGEKNGIRYFPIPIGEMEAQAVVASMQRIAIPRPTIYDVFAEYVGNNGGKLAEVVICGGDGGLFKAQMRFDEGAVVLARAADAICMALLFKCPIYVYEDILESESITRDLVSEKGRTTEDEIKHLQKRLDEAVRKENYELAAKLRDIISVLSKKREEPNAEEE